MFNDTLEIPVKNDNNNDNSVFKLLSEDNHFGVIVGLVAAPMPKYDNVAKKFSTTEKEDKFFIIWQVQGTDEEGKAITTYVKSQPLKPSLHEKSTLMKMLMGWSKLNTPAEVKKALSIDGVFKLENLIGKKASLTITHREYNGKKYPQIALVSAATKKWAGKDVIEDKEVPSFYVYVKDSTETLLHPLIAVKAKVVKEKVVVTANEANQINPAFAKKQAIEAPVYEEDEDEDGLPF
jgi:hypothetical protein